MTNHDRIAQNPHHRSFPEKAFTPKFSRENYFKKKKKKKKRKKKLSFLDMKKRQTYSIYQFTWRDLQRSQKKKSHHFPTKKLSRKTISKETNKYETRKRNRETVRHRYTSSSSSRSTSGDGKKLWVNFLEREREMGFRERGRS